MVRSNRRAAVAQVAEKVHLGSGRNVSEYTVLGNRRLARVSTAEGANVGRWSSSLMDQVFFYTTWMAGALAPLSWGT